MDSLRQVFIVLAVLTADCLCVLAESPLLLSLNNDSWSIRMAKNSTKYKATVPGGVYTDLRKAGVLEKDILFEDNDIKYRWVAKEDWIYSYMFDVPQTFLSQENVYLVFHGLDTVGEIFLNGKKLGDANNMFERYRFDVKPILKEKGNELEIKFESPIKAANRLSKESPYEIPPKCTGDQQNGECHVNFLRKMQASFSWDWGPAFPNVGIWKPVHLEAYNKVRVRSVSIITDKIMDTWEITTKAYIESAPNKEFKMRVELALFAIPLPSMAEIPRRPIKIKFTPLDVTVKTDANGEGYFTIDEIYISEGFVTRWWPNGYGNQRLYDLDMTVTTENEVNTTSTRFGFRTVKLVQDEVDCHNPKNGRTFYFEVNGIKIFAKGSNYVPSHILPELGTERDRVRDLLYSAKDTYTNMIRVWGGGVYETDEFYKLCDELGLMVWQDMMFACSMYPTDEKFLRSVSAEVVQNVRRLQHHPSIVLWAGNNENEIALAQNWYGTMKNFERYQADYRKLYVTLIKPLVESNDRSRPYITSSPTNGVKTAEENYISFSPSSNRYGDVHEYSYYSDNWEPSPIIPSRFSSEFGIQSLPSYSTLAEVAKPESLKSLDTDFFQKRQHFANGYSIMKSEIEMNLNLANAKDLKTQIYYSQINQAMSIKTKVEVYRRARDKLNEANLGMTMGAMYWQLNDVWQAPSWSSIEYGGKWKMLHYFAKSFFAPILVSPYVVDKNTLNVTVISDKRLGPPLKMTLKTTVYRWDSMTPVSETSAAVKLNPLSSVQAYSKPLKEVLDHHNLAINKECGETLKEMTKHCFITFKLMEKTTVPAPVAFLFPRNLNEIVGLKESKIKLTGVKITDTLAKNPFLRKETKKFELTLRTDNVALFVWLDVGKLPGRFYENGFLLTESEKKVNYLAFQPTTVCQFTDALTVQTIKGSFTVDESVKQLCDREMMQGDESHKGDAAKDGEDEAKKAPEPVKPAESKDVAPIAAEKKEPTKEAEAKEKPIEDGQASEKEKKDKEDGKKTEGENKESKKSEEEEREKKKEEANAVKGRATQLEFSYYYLLLPLVLFSML